MAKHKMSKKQEAFLHSKGKKMSPMALAKRKKSTMMNAAGKVMGGLYSK